MRNFSLALMLVIGVGFVANLRADAVGATSSETVFGVTGQIQVTWVHSTGQIKTTWSKSADVPPHGCVGVIMYNPGGTLNVLSGTTGAYSLVNDLTSYPSGTTSVTYWVGIYDGTSANVDSAHTTVNFTDDSPPKKVLVKYFNHETYTVKLRLFSQPSGASLGEITLAPNTGVISYVTLASSADTSATWQVVIAGITGNGPTYGIDAPTSETVINGGTLPGVVDTPSSPAPDPATQPTLTPPAGLPGASIQPSALPSDSPRPTVWAPTTGATSDADRLDKTTFKEGIGKLETALQSSIKDADLPTLPPVYSTETFAGNKTAVTTLAAKLPAVPTLPNPSSLGTQTTFVIPFAFRDASFPVTIDWGVGEAHMTIYRTMATWLLGLMFWVGSVRLLRQAVSPV